MTKKIFLLLFLILFSPLNDLQTRAEFFYSPTVIIVPAPNGKGESTVKISNPMGRATKVQLSLREWDILPDNRMVFRPYSEEDKNSILNYIQISPRQLTLAPKQDKIVRIATNIPPSFENKEYKLTLNMLEFNSDFKDIKTNDADRKYGLVVNKEVKAGAYIWKGSPAELKTNLQVKKISAEKIKTTDNKTVFGVKYQLTYENTGNIHDRRTIGIRLTNAETGKVEVELQKIGILVAYPTTTEPITFSSAFTIPKESDPTGSINPDKNYEVEFFLTERQVYNSEALDKKRPNPVIKLEKVKI